MHPTARPSFLETLLTADCSKNVSNDEWTSFARTSAPGPGPGPGPKPPCTDASTPCAQNYDDSAWRTVNTPHDFIVEGVANPSCDRGHGYLCFNKSWYRQTFTVPTTNQGDLIWLDFDGVYKNSDMWLNGAWLGMSAHIGAVRAFKDTPLNWQSNRPTWDSLRSAGPLRRGAATINAPPPFAACSRKCFSAGLPPTSAKSCAGHFTSGYVSFRYYLHNATMPNSTTPVLNCACAQYLASFTLVLLNDKYTH